MPLIDKFKSKILKDINSLKYETIEDNLKM